MVSRHINRQRFDVWAFICPVEYNLVFDIKSNRWAYNTPYKIYTSYLKKKKIEHAKLRYNLNHLDKMNPYEFEVFISQGLRSIGYKTEVTKGSGDYGIDVIAKKNGFTIGIQVKKYASKVGYDAVKEANTGAKYYKCDEAWVITSNEGFTRQAKEAAQKIDVRLFGIGEYALLLDSGNKKSNVLRV